QRYRGNSNLLCEFAQRPQRNLGDGLRRGQPASHHHLRIDFPFASYFARWLAAGFQFFHRVGMGNSNVLIRPQPASVFPRFAGTNLSPAWSPEGGKLAFSSSRSGDPEIYVIDQSGGNLHRITTSKGPDVSPVWNRKTGSQIAWVSGRT